MTMLVFHTNSHKKLGRKHGSILKRVITMNFRNFFWRLTVLPSPHSAINLYQFGRLVTRCLPLTVLSVVRPVNVKFAKPSLLCFSEICIDPSDPKSKCPFSFHLKLPHTLQSFLVSSCRPHYCCVQPLFHLQGNCRIHSKKRGLMACSTSALFSLF